MSLSAGVTLTVAGSLGLFLLGDTVRPAGRRVRLALGGAFLALAVILALSAVVREGDLGEQAAGAVERLTAGGAPDGGEGFVDALTLSTTEGRRLRLGHYPFGAYVDSDSPRIVVFVGEGGGSGSLSVAPRAPSGPDSGAQIFVRDAADKYSLSLDYQQQGRPRLKSESPSPLSIETPEGVDLRLSPGAGSPPKPTLLSERSVRAPGGAVTRARGRIVAAGDHPVALDGAAGTLTLPNLRRAPVGAARGSIALVRGRLVVRLDSWRPVSE